ncbi:MAG: hypothetical protein V4569_16895 [Pseudomonadota bacterium]
MTQALRLQAARLALGTLDADAIKATVEALVDAGVYLEPFLPALVERHPRFDDARPAFLAALDHHGIAVPDKEAAIRQLIEHYLRDLVSAPSDALGQLGRFMDEVYWHCHSDMPAKKYVGDSHGIERLLSLYWSAGDLRERQQISVNGQHGPQAWVELNHLIVAEAERWLAERPEPQDAYSGSSVK